MWELKYERKKIKICENYTWIRMLKSFFMNSLRVGTDSLGWILKIIFKFFLMNSLRVR